jgi:hypothetical protein
MCVDNPIIERIRHYQELGREVKSFLPHNILQHQKRLIVLEFHDGSTERFSFKGDFEAVKPLIQEAYYFLAKRTLNRMP